MARNKGAAKAQEERFQGVTTEGPAGYPHNHRLRAEALVEDGLEEDPDGVVTPELIADTRARLEAEANAPEPEEVEQSDDAIVDEQSDGSLENEQSGEPLVENEQA